MWSLLARPHLVRELQSSLMLFFTGAAHNSWHILEEQKSLASHTNGAALESMHQIRRASDQMREALSKGDFRAFGGLLHHSWEAKKRVSDKISNSLIDEAYSVARQSGALGGKITGAGGGGFLLLFCEEPHQRTSANPWRGSTFEK